MEPEECKKKKAVKNSNALGKKLEAEEMQANSKAS